MNTPLIVGIIVGTVLFPIYLTVGMIWLNKVKKYKKEKQPVGNSDCKETWVAECKEMTEWALDQRKRRDEEEWRKHTYSSDRFSSDEDLLAVKRICKEIHNQAKSMDGNHDNWHESSRIQAEMKDLRELFSIICEAGQKGQEENIS